MKWLIVNGDDFGRSAQVNAGILRAHGDGILTSASLMVAEPACAEAVAAASDCPNLDVGLHLVACNGKSLLPPRQLRGIVDDAGRFPRSEVWAGLRYALRPALRDRLKDEFRAQFERHLKMVGYLNHVNGHHNLHLHPTLFDIVLDLAAEYRVPCLRLVREPVVTTLVLAPDHAIRKLRDHAVFRWLSARAGRRMALQGVCSNDWTFGFHQTGLLTEEYVARVLDRLPDHSTTEFYFHPAIEAAGEPPMWPSQAAETEILSSAAVRAAVLRHGICLTTFREIAKQPLTNLAGGSARVPGG